MVAIFTGLGAGFERGSGAALGGGGLLGSSSLGRGGEGVFLNAANGNLLINRQDEFLVGRGPDIAIARTYNSLGQLSHDDNGDLWRQSTDRRIYGLTGAVNTVGSTIKRLSADGSEITYAYDDWDPGAGTDYYYRATDGADAHDRLEYNLGNDAWTWTDGSTQITETYAVSTGDASTIAQHTAGLDSDSLWRIQRQHDPDGNALTFAYLGSAYDKLKSVTTSANGVAEVIEYEWGAGDAENYITKVTVKYDHDLDSGTALAARSRTIYGYDGSNRLTSVTVDLIPEDTSDSSVYTTTYTYDGTSSRVATIGQADGSSLAIGYDALGRVITLVQTVESGARTTAISYNDEANGLLRTEITDPRGNITKIWSRTADDTQTTSADERGQLVRVMAPPATTGATPQEVNYTYDGYGNVAGVVTKSGSTTLSIISYQYDERGNVTQITDANGNVTARSYDAANNLELETRTGSASSSASTALYTRYIYDSENHLRFAISGEGRVTEYTYTPTGQVELVREFTKDAHRYEIGATLPALGTMETWVTNRGDLSSAKVIQNVYDPRGNLKETHRYGAATSGGLGATDEGTTKTTYAYDLHGRLLSRQVGAQATESFAYDGLDRLILSTDLAGGTTSIAFADAANTTTVVTLAAHNATSDAWEQTADSYVIISTYNKAGELIARADSGSIAGDGQTWTNGGTATHLYDKNGQLRVSTDATLRKSYFLYDKAGRKIADIGHDGQLIEYRYDQANRLVATARYQNKPTSTQLTTLGDPDSEVEIASIRPTAHSWDIWHWSVYDAGGRVIETVMGDGSVTTYAYDQADRLVKTQGFYNKLASVSGYFTTPPTALVLPAADANRDVVIRTFYDRDGRVIGSLNAEGALTRTLYDSAGQKIQEIAYANLTDPNQRASGTFDLLLASFGPDANRDVSSRSVYDGQGLLRFTIDALSRVTEYVYWEGESGTAHAHAHGLVRKTIVHSTPISVSDYSYATVKANVAIDDLDRVSYAVYNNQAQLRYSVDALGGVTELTYDSSGRVVKTTQYSVAKGTAMPPDSTTWEADLDSWRQGAGIAQGARVTRTYYAERGEARYVVDAEGYVTQNDYDAEGRLVSQLRYEDDIVVTDASTIGEVAAADKGGAVATQYVYDNMGRLQDVYDGVGVRRSKIYYANGALGYEIVALAQGTDESRVQYVYNQAGKLTTTSRWTSQTADASTSLGSTATVLAREKLVSPNGQYTALLTREGELRIYHKGEEIWRNGVRETVASATYRLVAQTDGNLVIYRDVQGQASVGIWSTNTAGAHSGATYMQMQNDGNFCLYKSTPFGGIWSTGTVGVVATDPNASEYVDAVTAYDGLGNVVSVTDFRGHATTFTYDKAGRVRTKTDPLSGVTSFEYDAFGRGVKVTDARGSASCSFFDKLGRVTHTLDAEGHVIETAYTAFSEVASVERYVNRELAAFAKTPWFADPTTISHEMMDASLVLLAHKAQGQMFAPNAWGVAVELLNGDRADGKTSVSGGDTLTFTFDAKRLSAGLTVQARFYVLHQDGSLTSEGWVTQGSDGWQTMSATITAAADAVAVNLGFFTYRPDGNVNGGFDLAIRNLKVTRNGIAAEIPTPAANSLDATTAFEYDELGRLIKITDGEGNVTIFQHDAFGNVVKKTGALDHASYYYYDKLNRLDLEIDAESYATVTTYNSTGTVESTTRRYNRATDVGNVAERPALSTNALDATTSFAYDGAGRVRTRTDAQGNVAEFEYDRRGNLVKVTEPGGAVSYNYYDKFDRLTLAIDAEGYATQTQYLPTGEVRQVTRYAAKVTGIGDVGKAPTLTATPAEDQVTTFAYDGLGRVLSATDAIGGITSYQYDANGNVVKTTDARGNASYAYYDKLNRAYLAVDAEGYATATTYQATGEVKAVTRSYNRVTGAITVIAPPAIVANAALDATTTVDYDKLGRVVRVIDALNQAEEYTLDALGNRLEVKNKLGGITENAFDKLGRLVLEQLPIKASNAEGIENPAFVENAYEYDARGNLIQKVAASNLGPELSRTTTYEYDRLGRRTATIGEAVAVAATATAAAVAIAPTERAIYDARGNVVETIAAEGARNLFWYDKRDRVTHKLSALGTLTRYIYDHASDNVAETHTYPTQTSLPLDATGPAPSHAALGAPRTTEYEYDKLGRVIEQRVLGVTSAALGTSFTVSTDSALITKYEYDANGNVTKTIDANERATYAYYDKLGRKITQIDAANYKTDWTYDAEGNVLSERRFAIAVAPPGPAAPASVNLMRGGDLSEGAGIIEHVWDGSAGGAFALAIESIDGAQALTLRKSGGTAPAWDPGYVWGGVLRSAGGDAANTRFSVSVGETVAFAIDVKQLAAGPHTIRASIAFLDANGQRIDFQGHQVGEGDSWQRLSGTGIAPEGAVYAQIEFGIRRSDGVTSGSMDFAVRNIQFHKLESGASAAPAWTPPAVSKDDRVTTFTYDQMGRRLTETRRAVLTYADQGGQVVQAPQDATIVYTYNEAGQVKTKTEASGDAVTYAYDLGGRLEREERAEFTDFNGAQVMPSVEYFYGGLDQLMRTEQSGNASAGERVTKYAYDLAGRMSSTTDAENFVRTYFYDIAGRVTREEYVRVTPTGSVEEAVGYDYDAEGRVTEQGALLKQSGDWVRTGASIGTTMMTYNAFGEVSARGVNGVYAETFEYDAAGRLERTNAGDGVWKYFVYDAVGNQTLMLATVGADFSEADGSLDTLGEVLALWGGDGSTIATVEKTGMVATITKYDARNQAVEVLEPKREVHVNGALTPSDLLTARAYNAFGEVTHEINAAGARVDYSYNTMGRLIKTESPAVSITGEDGAVTANHRPTEHLYYDAAGRLVASRDANDYLTSYTLLAGTGYGGSQALQTEVFTPDGAVTRTRYDIHGDARRIEDPLYPTSAPGLHVTTQNFDAMGRLVQMTRAASLTQSLTDYYRYDGLGQRIRHFNSFYNASYDPLQDPSGAGAVNAATTTYDHQGRVIQVVAAGGDTTKYAYAWDGTLLTKGMNSVDGLTGTPFGGWVKTTTFANGKALTEKSDVFAREVGKIDMSGHTTHFTYDKAGRLIQRSATHVVNGNTYAWGTALYQSYYNTGRLKEIYQPYDSHFTLGSAGGGYIYSNISISYRGSTFGYDKLGNVTSQVLSEAGTHTWQMTGIPGEPGDSGSDPFTFTISSQTASYDALGRIVSWSEAGSGQFFPNGAFHYRIGAATHSFAYDAAGNIRRSLATYRALNAQGAISSTESTQDYWYRYDAMNRMVTSKGVFAGAAGSGSIQRGNSGGVDTVYNLDGTRAYALTSSSPFSHWREQYYYDAAGRVLEVKAGSDPAAEPTARVGLFSYDALGRLLTQADYNGTSGYLGAGKTYERIVAYNAKNQIVSDDVRLHHSDDAYRTLSTYEFGIIVYNPDGSVKVEDTTYALGSALEVNAKGFKNDVDGNEPDRRTVNTYHWYDGAVAAGIAHTPSLSNPGTVWTTSYGYDVIGGAAQLETAYIADGRSRTVVWTNDMLGQVIRRSEKDNQAQAGDPHEIWHRMSGRQMGYVGNNGNYDVTYYASRGQRQTPGSPGPGSFADFDLAHDHINSYEQGGGGGVYTAQSGDTLQGIAANLWGDASLWYKIAEVNGLTGSETLIEGQLIIVPRGVQRNENNANTFQPYDPLEVLGNTSPTSPRPNNVKQCGVAGQVILAVLVYAVAVYVNPYLANVVQQGVMMATGHQEEFSWEQFAVATITAGITSYVSGGYGGVNVGQTAAAQMTSNAAAQEIVGAAVNGAIGSAAGQGVSMALGIQDKFSWSAVAAAAVGAAVGAWAMPTAALKNIGDKFGAESSQFASASFIRASASGVANAATRSLMNNGDFGDNMLAALPDVIGQTMGTIAGAQRDAPTEPVGAEDIAPIQWTPLDEPVELSDIALDLPEQAQRRHSFYLAPGASLSPVDEITWTWQDEEVTLTNPITLKSTTIPRGERDLASDYEWVYTNNSSVGLHLTRVDVLSDTDVVQHLIGDLTGGPYYEFSLSSDGPDSVTIEGLGGLTISRQMQAEPAALRDMVALWESAPEEVRFTAAITAESSGYITRSLMQSLGPEHYAEYQQMLAGDAEKIQAWNDYHVELGDWTPEMARNVAIASGVLFVVLGTVVPGGRIPRHLRVVEIDGYQIGPHGGIRRDGGQSHHAVQRGWDEIHTPRYNKEDAPAIRLSQQQHNDTRREYNAWIKELQQENPRFRLRDASESQVRELAERQFVRAGVPDAVRAEYWRQRAAYISSLANRE